MTSLFFLRHSKLALVLAVIFLVLGTSSAWATISRINSLGGNGDFIEDDANVRRWFGSLSDYPDQAVMESGNFNIDDGYWQTSSQKVSGPGIGIHYGLGQNNKWGTIALSFHDHNDDGKFSMTPERLRNNFEAIYAYDFGLLTAAAFLGHGNRNYEQVGVEIDYSANNVGLGARINMSDSAYLDIAWESQYTNLQNSSFTDGEGSDSESNDNLRARAFIALGKNSALVPMAEVIHEDRLQPFIVPVHLENRLSHIGCGFNYFPDTDHLFLISTEYIDGQRKNYISESYAERNWSVWSIKAGFESRILSWLTTRGSLSGHFDHQYHQVLNTGSETFNIPAPEDPSLRINLGLSVHLGAADLDINFGEQYPERVYLGTQPDPRKPWLSATARLFF